MDLKNKTNFFAQILFFYQLVGFYHREFDNVGLRSLEGCIDCHALRLRAQIRQERVEAGKISSPPKKRFRISCARRIELHTLDPHSEPGKFVKKIGRASCRERG